MARLVHVKVNPKARLNKVEEDGEDGYVVWTSAVPDKGAANDAVVRALAKHLNVGRSQVILIRGATARRKVFAIEE